MSQIHLQMTLEPQVFPHCAATCPKEQVEVALWQLPNPANLNSSVTLSPESAAASSQPVPGGYPNFGSPSA